MARRCAVRFSMRELRRGDGALSDATRFRLAFEAFRRTAQYDAAPAAKASTNELAAWAYDNSNTGVSGMTYPIGHLTTATTYVGGTAGSAGK